MLLFLPGCIQLFSCTSFFHNHNTSSSFNLSSWNLKDVYVGYQHTQKCYIVYFPTCIPISLPLMSPFMRTCCSFLFYLIPLECLLLNLGFFSILSLAFIVPFIYCLATSQMSLPSSKYMLCMPHPNSSTSIIHSLLLISLS